MTPYTLLLPFLVAVTPGLRTFEPNETTSIPFHLSVPPTTRFEYTFIPEEEEAQESPSVAEQEIMNLEPMVVSESNRNRPLELSLARQIEQLTSEALPGSGDETPLNKGRKKIITTLQVKFNPRHHAYDVLKLSW
ncbi:MAG TPA: hypothetical protein VKC60_06750 [Opitutaceae bacterium]|nr:hypothetical protein [Opitutaceae bacterium]